MGLFSSSKSRSTTSNTTDIDTTTVSSVTGNAFALGESSNFRGEVGLTGQNFTDAVLGFTQGAVQIERLRASSFNNAPISGDSGGGSKALFATLPAKSEPMKFNLQGSLPIIGVALTSLLVLFTFVKR